MSAPRHPNHRPTESLPPELRRPIVPRAVREWIGRSTGQPVVRTERLHGASSTAVHRVHFANGSSLVLRRYAWPGFLEDEPVAPERELEALRFANRNGIAAPSVIAADVTGADVGDGIPVMLMTFRRGRALAAPDPVRLAETAASVHVVDPAGFGHAYFPWFGQDQLRVPSAASQPRLWERALDVFARGAPAFGATFIHRDFHPGNVLWHRGRSSAIVDWANACIGPAACDVATCHGNLIGWAGYEHADAFVAAYESLTGEGVDPYWEIASVLEHGPSPWSSEAIVQSERRLGRAVAELGA